MTTIRIEGTRLGDLTVDSEDILSFPDGLPGFPGSHRYVLVDAGDEEPAVLWWLQSVDEPEVAFLCAAPWPFFPDYAPELPDTEAEDLELTDPADALVLVLLTVHRDDPAGPSVTANLLGPVIVNRRTRVGRQVVLADSDWPLRAPLAA